MKNPRATLHLEPEVPHKSAMSCPGIDAANPRRPNPLEPEVPKGLASELGGSGHFSVGIMPCLEISDMSVRVSTRRWLASILASVAGSVGGLLIGGMPLGWPLFAFIFSGKGPSDEGWVSNNFVFVCLGFAIGANLGAAAGVTIVRKLLRQRASFVGALLGVLGGFLFGVAPMFTIKGIGTSVAFVLMVTGAVAGSYWHAKM